MEPQKSSAWLDTELIRIRKLLGYGPGSAGYHTSADNWLFDWNLGRIEHEASITDKAPDEVLSAYHWLRGYIYGLNVLNHPSKYRNPNAYAPSTESSVRRKPRPVSEYS